MQSSSKLNFSLISKRLTCKNSTINESGLTRVSDNNRIDAANSEKYYKDICSLIESNNAPDVLIREKLFNFMNYMSNTESATKQWYYPLDIAQRFHESYAVLEDFIVERYCSNIIPYSDSLKDVESCLEYNDVVLSSDNKAKIIDTVKLTEAADRIINNHNQISKRFNMENVNRNYNSLGLKYLVDSVAMKIDTYAGVKPYQKMNLTIEECYYLLNKSGSKYDTQDLVKYTLEFFLLENSFISKTDINNFSRALNENYLLEEDDLNKVDIIFNNSNTQNSISNRIALYYTLSDKSVYNLISTVKDTLYNTTKEDIIYNFDKLLYFLWDIIKSEILGDNVESIYSVFDIIGDYIEAESCSVASYILSDKQFNREEINSIIEKINQVSKVIENFGRADKIYTLYSNNFIGKGLCPLVDKLTDLANTLYSDSNITNIEIIDNCIESVDYDKFKSLYFTDMVSTSKVLHNLISVKENKTDINITNLSSTVIENIRENFDSYIGSDNKAEITLRQYILGVNENNKVSLYLDSICNECNDLLQSQNYNNLVCYYVTTENVAEIRLKDKRFINLPEDYVNESCDLDAMIYIDYLKEALNSCSIIESFSGIDLEEYLTDFTKYNTFTKEHFDLAIEALKYIDIDSNTVQLFAERFNEYQFNTILESTGVAAIGSLAIQEKAVLNEVSNWEEKKVENVPYELQIEATSYLVALLENLADDWDDIEYDDDEEDEKKPQKPEKEQDKENEEKLKHDPKFNKDAKDVENYTPSRSTSKISLHKLKLGILGLHGKFKEMSTKQKEISKNLDNSVRALVKGIKNLFVSDRREAIIKGSIIPSFSRCINNGLLLAGLGVGLKKFAGATLSSSIVIPAIVAIGGIALSKRLSKKERLLLLDEIETELEVVDKELQIAESNNKMNQYRALLQYKKNLQRQYQRIRYNIRIGKDIMPSSSTGVPTSNS